jgi:hypothetical protein
MRCGHVRPFGAAVDRNALCGRAELEMIGYYDGGEIYAVVRSRDRLPPSIQQQSKQAQSKQSQSKQAQRDGEAPQGAPLIVLVPVAVASSDSLGDGCWARLYDGANFRGNQLSLVGPVDMPNMRTAFGTDWGGEFDSIQVGPKASVTVYDNENHREKAATFKAGQRVPDLSDKVGLFEDIRSLKIACAGGGPAAKQGGQNSSASTGSSANAQ